MITEEVLAIIQKYQDVLKAFSQSIADAAQTLEDMFRKLAESDKLWPKRNGMPPKKYGMTLQKRRRKSVPCYHYTPPIPRNRPYQRRIF